jgi:hypothetical protein
MGQADRRIWAASVQEQLLEVFPENAEVVILAGMRYREHLVPFLRERGFMVSVPMQGLSIGRQLRFLKLDEEIA